MKKPPDPEMIRRLRLGDLKLFLRHRYGHTLPDDDAGRADLHELLLPVSLGPKSPDRIMRNMIETWAPWMEASEAYVLIQNIESIPRHERFRTGGDQGRILNLTNAERERLKLRTIQAADLTDEQKAEHRKAKRRHQDRLRKQRQRRRKGRQSRIAYLAASRTRLKPWEKEGVSRRTWYRRNAKVGTASGTGCSANKHLDSA